MKRNDEPKLHVVGADPRETSNDQTTETKKQTLWDFYNLDQETFAKMVQESHQEFAEILEKTTGAAAITDNVLRYLADNNRSEASRAAIVHVLINNSNELYETKQLMGRLIGPYIGEAIGPTLQQLAAEIGGLKSFIKNSTEKK